MSTSGLSNKNNANSPDAEQLEEHSQDQEETPNEPVAISENNGSRSDASAIEVTQAPVVTVDDDIDFWEPSGASPEIATADSLQDEPTTQRTLLDINPTQLQDHFRDDDDSSSSDPTHSLQLTDVTQNPRPVGDVSQNNRDDGDAYGVLDDETPGAEEDDDGDNGDEEDAINEDDDEDEYDEEDDQEWIEFGDRMDAAQVTSFPSLDTPLEYTRFGYDRMAEMEGTYPHRFPGIRYHANMPPSISYRSISPPRRQVSLGQGSTRSSFGYSSEFNADDVLDLTEDSEYFVDPIRHDYLHKDGVVNQDSPAIDFRDRSEQRLLCIYMSDLNLLPGQLMPLLINEPKLVGIILAAPENPIGVISANYWEKSETGEGSRDEKAVDRGVTASILSTRLNTSPGSEDELCLYLIGRQRFKVMPGHQEQIGTYVYSVVTLIPSIQFQCCCYHKIFVLPDFVLSGSPFQLFAGPARRPACSCELRRDNVTVRNYLKKENAPVPVMCANCSGSSSYLIPRSALVRTDDDHLMAAIVVGLERSAWESRLSGYSDVCTSPTNNNNNNDDDGGDSVEPQKFPNTGLSQRVAATLIRTGLHWPLRSTLAKLALQLASSKDPLMFCSWVLRNSPIADNDFVHATLEDDLVKGRLCNILKVVRKNDGVLRCRGCKARISSLYECFSKTSKLIDEDNEATFTDVRQLKPRKIKDGQLSHHQVNYLQRFHFIAGDTTISFVNAVGVVFDVLTVRRASNVTRTTPYDGYFSWFPGYDWSIIECSNCHLHLGWYFKRQLKFHKMILKHQRDTVYGAWIAAIKSNVLLDIAKWWDELLAPDGFFGIVRSNLIQTD